MQSYADLEVFTVQELSLLHVAQGLVERFPSYDPNDQLLRCHEVARVVATSLGLQIQDGFYGMADHTWCWTTPPEPFSQPPNILDVYCLGRLPQVQLVHSSNYLPFEYRKGPTRGDIKQDVIEYLNSFIGPEQFGLVG